MYNHLKLSFLFIPLSLHASTNLKDFFTKAYEDAINGVYGKVESMSGPGSSLEQTRIVRSSLPSLIQQLGIQSILDAPCGDFHWMSQINLGHCNYIGIDIVESMIKKNATQYTSNQHSFLCADALHADLPYADLIISRDFLVHLSDTDVVTALRNFKRSGAKYLLTTTFFSRSNYNITSGGWRPINLQRAPFNFPAPIAVIIENCTEQEGAYADKSLGMWKLEDINV